MRQAVEAMGCEVISNTTSLVVLNLPGKLAGKEKDLVAECRAHGFGIWLTLSEPIQVRIGILNQLSPEQITEIASRFAGAMLDMGAEFDKQQVMNGLKSTTRKLPRSMPLPNANDAPVSPWQAESSRAYCTLALGAGAQ